MSKLLSLMGEGQQRIKTLIYIITAILVIVAWVLTLTVVTKEGDLGSATKFYFFLTWLSAPALLYLAVTPLWSRFKKFESIYFVTMLDLALSIFWLSALAAVQVWTQSGIQDNSQGCAQFDYGSESKCIISHATVIVGAIICLLWIAASVVSIYCLIHYTKTGFMPNDRPPSREMSKNTFDAYPSLFSKNTSKTDEAVGHPQTRLYGARKDLEHGFVFTETLDTNLVVRPGSWHQEPPMTAPPGYGTPPIFNTIYYGETPQDEPAPISYIAPLNFTSRFMTPPERFSTPPNRYATPPNLQIPIPGLREDDDNCPISLSATGYAPYDFRRSVMRQPAPGPASRHVGGYRSAYHTPLPTGLAPQQNSWRTDQALGGAIGRLEKVGRLAYPAADYSR